MPVTMTNPTFTQIIPPDPAAYYFASDPGPGVTNSGWYPWGFEDSTGSVQQAATSLVNPPNDIVIDAYDQNDSTAAYLFRYNNAFDALTLRCKLTSTSTGEAVRSRSHSGRDSSGNIYVLLQVGQVGSGAYFSIVKLDGTTGEIVWQRHLTDGIPSILHSGMKVASDGRVFCIFYDSSDGLHKLVAFNTDGTVNWIKDVDWGSGSVSSADIALSESDSNIFIAGPANISGSSGIFISKVSMAGAHQWARSIVYSGYELPYISGLVVYNTGSTIVIAAQGQNISTAENVGIYGGVTTAAGATSFWRRINTTSLDTLMLDKNGICLDSTNKSYILTAPLNSSTFVQSDNCILCSDGGTTTYRKVLANTFARAIFCDSTNRITIFGTDADFEYSSAFILRIPNTTTVSGSYSFTPDNTTSKTYGIANTTSFSTTSFTPTNASLTATTFANSSYTVASGSFIIANTTFSYTFGPEKTTVTAN